MQAFTRFHGIYTSRRLAGTAALMLLLSIPVAWAEKPSWAGGGHGAKAEHPREKGPGAEHAPHKSPHSYERPAAKPHKSRDHFDERQRLVLQQYFVSQYDSGRCPPGLQKKRNGCLPPGQAKKWRIGQPLPRGVVYYDLPSSLVIELGVPPVGHRYVRIAADILLIAIGTGMVVDAIEDLGRL